MKAIGDESQLVRETCAILGLMDYFTGQVSSEDTTETPQCANHCSMTSGMHNQNLHVVYLAFKDDRRGCEGEYPTLQGFSIVRHTYGSEPTKNPKHFVI